MGKVTLLFSSLVFLILPHIRKGIQDSLGFWIPRLGFWIPGFGCQSVRIPIVGGIPDSLSCIPDSNSKMFSDSFSWVDLL